MNGDREADVRARYLGLTTLSEGDEDLSFSLHPVRRGELEISRDRYVVADLRDRLRRACRPVAVNHQATVALKDERAAETLRKSDGNRFRADIGRNVLLETFIRQPQIAERPRYRRAGMLAHEQEAA